MVNDAYTWTTDLNTTRDETIQALVYIEFVRLSFTWTREGLDILTEQGVMGLSEQRPRPIVENPQSGPGMSEATVQKSRMEVFGAADEPNAATSLQGRQANLGLARVHPNAFM